MTIQPHASDLPVLAIIPAYNEGQRIAPVVAETARRLQVCVIDDGSSDNTSAAAKESGAEVILLPYNQGKGAALKEGFRFAVEEGYEAVISLDADGQHDPSEIPKFLHLYRERKPELIIGARNFREMPPVRRAANWLGRKSLSWAMGRNILDNQSGFRCISRALMQDMVNSSQGGFEFEVEMILVCVQRGYNLEWVEIKTIYAGESSHINPVTHFVNYVKLVIRTRRTIKSSGG